MACSCCGFGDTADRHFNGEKVAKELRQYRRKGPGVTTRKLRDGLIAADLTRGTVLDIGGGLGALSLSLLDAGMEHAVVVDASSAYLAAASEEAARRERSSSTQFVHGDFLTVAGDLAPATVVTLDRVVCCYPAYRPLLEKSLARAEHGFALSYPRDRWYVRFGMWCENALRRRRGNPFRTFVHPPAELQRTIERAGFRLANRAHTMTWTADVFIKAGDSHSS
jgi:magnesium-protoporphyrin O-methyltransferase